MPRDTPAPATPTPAPAAPGTAIAMLLALTAGFAMSQAFRTVAAIEKEHETRYRALLKNVEMQRVFEKSEEVIWECRVCGHLVIGRKAPEVCPVCMHSQSHFEIRQSNF